MKQVNSLFARNKLVQENALEDFNLSKQEDVSVIKIILEIVLGSVNVFFVVDSIKYLTRLFERAYVNQGLSEQVMGIVPLLCVAQGQL